MAIGRLSQIPSLNEEVLLGRGFSDSDVSDIGISSADLSGIGMEYFIFLLTDKVTLTKYGESENIKYINYLNNFFENKGVDRDRRGVYWIAVILLISLRLPRYRMKER
ncbi:hypothetical protein [Xenorhabdus thuongxuanensis]|uniref:hypothetical protein n=1 Tax=Xenorhabdus thuongxuanensis TaxID=1873484 RepID=UPI001FC9AA37|nr:hypothetical protein [Xenorhabdus thuongxuanensis]